MELTQCGRVHDPFCLRVIFRSLCGACGLSRTAVYQLRASVEGVPHADDLLDYIKSEQCRELARREARRP